MGIPSMLRLPDRAGAGMTVFRGIKLTDRQAVLVDVGRRTGSGDWARGWVASLSQAGCTLVLDERLPGGTPVSVMFPGFTPRAAVIAEADGEVMQCRFDEPLPAAIFDHLVRMSDRSARG